PGRADRLRTALVAVEQLGIQTVRTQERRHPQRHEREGEDESEVDGDGRVLVHAAIWPGLKTRPYDFQTTISKPVEAGLQTRLPYLKLSMISSSAALLGRTREVSSDASGSSTRPSRSTKSCLSGST